MASLLTGYCLSSPGGCDELWGKTAAAASCATLAVQLCSTAEWAVMVSGHRLKACEKGLGPAKADTELWTSCVFSTEDNETSKEFKQELFLIKRKKQSYISFLITVSVQIRKVWKGRNRSHITFFPPHMLQINLLFDPNTHYPNSKISWI